MTLTSNIFLKIFKQCIFRGKRFILYYFHRLISFTHMNIIQMTQVCFYRFIRRMDCISLLHFIRMFMFTNDPQYDTKNSISSFSLHYYMHCVDVYRTTIRSMSTYAIFCNNKSLSLNLMICLMISGDLAERRRRRADAAGNVLIYK